MFEPVESGTIQINGKKYKYRIITGGYGGGYNGYVTFPKRPTRETSYCGILTYVPVHGGITYTSEGEDGSMEYGFDTAHFDSENYPRTDINWIKDQIREMTKGILRAAEVEDKYLACKTNKGKAKHAEYVRGGEHEPNFGEMMNILSGQL